MKKQCLFSIFFVSQLFLCLPASAGAPPDHAPVLLQADFAWLGLQSHLEGFWASLPRQRAFEPRAIVDYPWSITASGNAWQTWGGSAYSAAWSGPDRAGLGLLQISAGLDRSFRDQRLLGFSLDLGRYWGNGDLDAKGRIAAGKVHAAFRLPSGWELASFFGLTGSWPAGQNQAQDGRMSYWSAGLGLGRSFNPIPMLAIRPTTGYEILASSRIFSESPSRDFFVRHRGRLGLEVLARLDKLAAKAGLFVEGQAAFQTGDALADAEQDLYWGAYLEATCLLGPGAELALQYRALSAKDRRSRQAGLILRVFF